MSNPFCFIDRLKSFKFAFTGIWTMLKSQHNCWVHFVATVLVIVAGVFFKVFLHEWCLLVLAIIIVWAAEAFNTSFEFLADAVSPDFHPLVEKAKDVAAGAVLIAAFGAVIIGLLIFMPYIFTR